jgi:FLVCR family MFS transporter 7
VYVYAYQSQIIYVLAFAPASWFYERYGLRTGVLGAALLQSLGPWVQVCFLSPSPSGFAWIFVGQAFISTAGPFILGTPPRLAVMWFPEHERATAMGILIFANTLGKHVHASIVSVHVNTHTRHLYITRFLWCAYMIARVDS